MQNEKKRFLRVALAAALLLSLAGSLFAGEDAVLDRGFQPDAVYDTHDIDEVNQFNGNLSVNVPLGPRFRTNGSLEYGFTLNYNSSFWDYSDHSTVGSASSIHKYLNLWSPVNGDDRPDGGDLQASEAHPSHTLNAGLGWLVSLGELYRGVTGEFLWVAPDGGKHLFYTLLHEGSAPVSTSDEGYTRDGTYIRMTTSRDNGHTDRILHFPDGIRHRYRCVGSCTNAAAQQYELNQIADPFGNVLYVRHTVRPNSGQWLWTYHEATLRQDPTPNPTDTSANDLYADSDVPSALTEVRRHEIEYTVDNIAYMRVTRLSLAGPGGVPATFSFDYSTDDVYRPFGSTWYSTTDIVYPFTAAQDGKLRIKQLRSVNLPAGGGTWRFDYYQTQPDDPDTPYDDAEQLHRFNYDNVNYTIWWYVSRFSGLLSSVTYPTGGKVQYRYGTRAYPKKMCHVPGVNAYVGVGVSKRQRYRVGAQGVFERDPQGIWLYYGTSYRDVLWPGCNAPTELQATAVDPFGNTTVSFFSIFVGDNGGDLPPWDRREFGLALTKAAPPSGDRYLSTQVYRCNQAQFTGASTAAELTQRLRYIVKRLRPAGTPGTCHDDVRNSDEPLRETYVKFEHSGFACDPRLDASGCFASNRRLAKERVFYRDDNNSFADTEWTDFDGAGHYRTVTMSGGGLLAASPTRIETTNYNPGSSETSLPPYWVFNTYDRRTWDEGGKRALALFQFDRKSGFLQSHRAVAASGNRDANGIYADPALAGNDLLRTVSRHREGDGATIVIEENSYGGDRIPIGSTPEYRALRKMRHGTESHFEHLTSGLPVLQYDRDIDPSGVMLTETTASGLTTRFTYDAGGRMTEAFHTNAGSTLPIEGEASLGYVYKAANGTSEGQLASVTVSRPAGCSGSGCAAQTTHTYDLYGRLFVTKGRLPDFTAQSRLQRNYFATGWPLSVSTAGLDGQAVYASASDLYDPFGRPGRLRDPEGKKTTELSYGGIRTVARRQFGLAVIADNPSDPNTDADPTTYEEYDRHGRLIKLSEWADPLQTSAGALAVYEYDVLNRLTSADLLGTASGGTKHQKRTFVWDNRGFLTKEFHPEINANVSYRYDSGGNVISRTVEGHPDWRLTYLYDDAGRLTDVKGVSDGRERPYKKFTYFEGNDDDCGPAGYASGKLKSAARHNYIPSPAETSKTIDVTVTDFFTYTSGPGWVSRKSTTVNSSDPAYSRLFTFTQQFAHSPLGLPSLITYPSCSGCGPLVLPERRLSNIYKFGFLTAVNGYAPKISYHPNGLIDEVQHAGADAGVTDVLLNDEQGRPRPRALFTRGVISTDGTHSEDLNPAGRLKYEYDRAGNLMGVGTYPGDAANPEYRRYRYDSMSRLRRATVGTQPVRDYEYDRWGNLLTAGGVDPDTNRLRTASYDGFGNVGSWRSYVYQYDAFNAMTYVRSPLVEQMFVYDAGDERLGTIDNRVAPATPDDPPGRRESWTVRDPENKVLRVVENTNDTWTWKKDYIHRGSTLLASEGAEGTRHFHLDHLGTVRLITDPHRRVVARHVYYPFGEEISDPDADGDRMKFAGHERDNLNPVALGRDGDLDYMHARFFNPASGRFLSVDPLLGTPASSQSWNRYTYAGNSPAVMIDPDGRSFAPGTKADPECHLCNEQESPEQEAQTDDGTTCDDSGCVTNVTASDPAKEANYGLNSETRSRAAQLGLDILDMYINGEERYATFVMGFSEALGIADLDAAAFAAVLRNNDPDYERQLGLVDRQSFHYKLGYVDGAVTSVWAFRTLGQPAKGPKPRIRGRYGKDGTLRWEPWPRPGR